MVDYKEEQEMEMEALEAMFCDEYSVIDDKSFSITVVPVQGGVKLKIMFVFNLCVHIRRLILT